MNKVFAKRKYLRIFNRVRYYAQQCNDELFKKHYKNIVKTILDEYRKIPVSLSDDHMKVKVKNSIAYIRHFAETCQYVPNNPPRGRNYTKPDFSEHNILLKIENVCDEILKNNF